MKLSSFKISVQIALVLCTFAIILSALFFTLNVFNQKASFGTFAQGMVSTKSALESASETLSKDISSGVENANTQVSNSIADLSKESLRNLSRQVAAELDIQIEDAMGQSRALANSIKVYQRNTSQEELKREIVLGFIEGMKVENPQFSGVWVCFEPNAFDGKDELFVEKQEFGCEKETGRFIPWGNTKNSKVVFDPLIDPETEDYYKVSKQRREEFVTSPYLYEGAVFITAAVPMIVDNKFIGVAGIDLPVEIVKKALEGYKPFGDGFTYLVDASGLIVWHPKSSMITEEITKYSGRQPLLDGIKRGNNVQITLIDQVTSKNSLQTLTCMTFGRCSDNWGLVVSAPVESIMVEQVKVANLLTNLKTSAETQVKELVDKIDETNQNSEKEMEKGYSQSFRSSIILSAVLVVIALIIAILFGRSFAAPIIAGVQSLRQVAEQGDISIVVPQRMLDRGDEIGDFAHGIEKIIQEFQNVASLSQALASGNWTVDVRPKSDVDEMNQHLRLMIKNVKDALSEVNSTVIQVATGSSEVANTAEDLSAGAQKSAASVEEISASMREIKSKAEDNAHKATQAQTIASQTREVAVNGKKSMEQMIAAMERITQNSNQVQQVIRVIDDIAFQTNLLALNAAVEAARAGQHGKGFAVVAEEVRNLAGRSAKAAHETSELISLSSKEIETGAGYTNKTAEVLDEMVEQVTKTTDFISQISAASAEQAENVEQITSGLTQIESVIQQNTASAEESASASNQMSAQANSLKELVGRFKIK